MRKKRTENSTANFGESTCPRCNSRSVNTMIQNHKFIYGEETEAVELEANVPIRECNICRFQFTDHVAEEIKHDVVCSHLGVMSPKKIRNLRETYGFTRADFAKLTKIGEASLARWETGILIQNQAYDQFLYLLLFKENIECLEKRNMDLKAQKEDKLHDEKIKDDPGDDLPRFNVLHGGEVERQQEYARVFELRRAG